MKTKHTFFFKTLLKAAALTLALAPAVGVADTIAINDTQELAYLTVGASAEYTGAGSIVSTGLLTVSGEETTADFDVNVDFGGYVFGTGAVVNFRQDVTIGTSGVNINNATAVFFDTARIHAPFALSLDGTDGPTTLRFSRYGEFQGSQTSLQFGDANNTPGTIQVSGSEAHIAVDEGLKVSIGNVLNATGATLTLDDGENGSLTLENNVTAGTLNIASGNVILKTAEPSSESFRAQITFAAAKVAAGATLHIFDSVDIAGADVSPFYLTLGGAPLGGLKRGGGGGESDGTPGTLRFESSTGIRSTYVLGGESAGSNVIQIGATGGAISVGHSLDVVIKDRIDGAGKTLSLDTATDSGTPSGSLTLANDVTAGTLNITVGSVVLETAEIAFESAKGDGGSIQISGGAKLTIYDTVDIGAGEGSLGILLGAGGSKSDGGDGGDGGKGDGGKGGKGGDGGLFAVIGGGGIGTLAAIGGGSSSTPATLHFATRSETPVHYTFISESDGIDNIGVNRLSSGVISVGPNLHVQVNASIYAAESSLTLSATSDGTSSLTFGDDVNFKTLDVVSGNVIFKTGENFATVHALDYVTRAQITFANENGDAPSILSISGGATLTIFDTVDVITSGNERPFTLNIGSLPSEGGEGGGGIKIKTLKGDSGGSGSGSSNAGTLHFATDSATPVSYVFAGDSYTAGDNTINIGEAGGTIKVDANLTVTILDTVEDFGRSTLTKNGTGALILANTVALGNVNIAEGKLAFTKGSAESGGGLSIFSADPPVIIGGTLTVGEGATVQIGSDTDIQVTSLSLANTSTTLFVVATDGSVGLITIGEENPVFAGNLVFELESGAPLTTEFLESLTVFSFTGTGSGSLFVSALGGSGGWTFNGATGTFAAIPEPSTYALFGAIGAVALALVRRRKNKK